MKKKVIFIGLMVVIFLGIIGTIPFWGYKAFPDMNLPRPEEIFKYGYKSKNLLPMYGNLNKTMEEKRADEEFINAIILNILC